MPVPHRSSPESSPEPSSQPTGCVPALLRLTWIALGNMALLICAIYVAKWASVVMDIVFFSVAAVMVAVRYVDISWYGGQTAEGEPATLSHWRRYAVLLSIAAAGLWALARVAAYRGFA